jgi:acyl carrier protein/NRPS condensation-like uncharacterized protein
VVRGDVTEKESSADNPKSEIENKLSPWLVAYVLPNEEQPLINELRGVLKKKLPEYMIPSSFVILEAFPLMPNGKVDRNKLPPPDGTRSFLSKEFDSPRTETEELIAQIWREVLKINNLGIYDNFFELGGHSLLAIQIVTRLQEAFNKEVSLRVLFDAPTIAELARELETIICDGHTPGLSPIVPAPRDVPLPLSVNQEHLWHLDQMMPGTHFFNMPYVYRLSGDLNVQALEKALTEIIRRHEALRTVFAILDGQTIQIVKDFSGFQLPVEDMRGLATGDLEEAAAQLILATRIEPFDLAVGPLLRIKLLRLTNNVSLLSLVLHHIISDYWSMRVFRRELLLLYQAFSHRHSSPPPDPPIRFADFAFWERRVAESEIMRTELKFWNEQLSGRLPLLEFQKKTERKKEPDFRTFRQTIEVDENLFSNIQLVAKNENCTPFMVVVAALSLVLFDLTGQTDIRIGTLAANRRRKETELVMGHFVNTVILRITVTPRMTFTQLLRQVRYITLMAYTHQELPFEQLARALEAERNITRRSLFQVLVNYESYVRDSPESAGLTIAPLDLNRAVVDANVTPTTFDLTFDWRETSTRLTGSVNYRTENCDADEVAGLIQKILSYLKAHCIHGTDVRNIL